MQQSLFSTYSTGENRITASVMAVLQSLSLGRIEGLLGAMMEESEFELVRFRNQPSKDKPGVPDAEIVANCRVLVETKIKTGALSATQIKRHLKGLDKETESLCRLLLLTPDQTRPPLLDKLKDDRVVWSSFAFLDQAINELLDDGTQVISEREAFLLRELQKMLAAEGLIGSEKDVVVVPARGAWRIYQKHHAYICQSGRSFQRTQHIAFYCNGAIQPLVPRIEATHDDVLFEPRTGNDRLSRLINELLDIGQRKPGDIQQVFLLSPPADERTLHLNHPIDNDLQSASGRTVAFTQNQRYVALEQLQQASTTSELVDNQVSFH